MAAKRWFPLLRSVVAIGRNLRDISLQLTRIADHFEGVTPAQPLADEPAESIHYSGYRNDAELARVEVIEQEMFGVLGRLPDADEVVAALDGVEWSDADAGAHRERVRKYTEQELR